jgi:hypothetical protein
MSGKQSLTRHLRVRKRAKGGGRKPAGPATDMREALSARIRSETMLALRQTAQQRGWSVSQVIEELLRKALNRPSKSERRNQALARAIIGLIETIEDTTGEAWSADAFTADAIRTAIFQFMLEASPAGLPVLPHKLKETLAEHSKEVAEFLTSPTALGAWVANSATHELASVRGGPHNEWASPMATHLPAEIISTLADDLKERHAGTHQAARNKQLGNRARSKRSRNRQAQKKVV